jgi:hypothetical protein
LKEIDVAMNYSSQRLNLYRPSGIAPFAGVLGALFLGVLGGVLLGAVYGYANYHDPLIYLNVLLTGAFGLALGGIVSKGIRYFRIRSVFAACAVALAAFGVAYTVHWFFYISVVIVDLEGYSPFSAGAIVRLAFSFMRAPMDARDVVRELNAEGIWSVAGQSGRDLGIEPKGVVLTGIWVMEALAICYFSVKPPCDEAGKPYSERLDGWIQAKDLPLPIAFVEDVESFKSALARGDYSKLLSPLASDGDLADHARVILYADAVEPCLTVENISVKVKKKKKEVSGKNVVRYLKIPPETALNIAKALAG